MRLISWNLHCSHDPWQVLAADEQLDFALVQEAKSAPPPDTALEVVAGGGWTTAGWESRQFGTAVVRNTRQHTPFRAEPVSAAPLGAAGYDELAVSRWGSLAVATVTGATLAGPVTVASVYAAWERPVPYDSSGWIYADASAHRVVSDLSALIGSKTSHRIVVAGDWNILRGYGESGDEYWARRYASVFERMDAIGLPLVGPVLPSERTPHDPRGEIPEALKKVIVPTYRTKQDEPLSATRQLDFVFASRPLVESIQVRSLDSPDVTAADHWGPSDHCRIEILIDEPQRG